MPGHPVVSTPPGVVTCLPPGPGAAIPPLRLRQATHLEGYPVLLKPEQVTQLDALRQELRQLEQLRRSINARIASGRLSMVRPLFFPTFTALYGDIERALLDHELERNRELAA